MSKTRVLKERGGELFLDINIFYQMVQQLLAGSLVGAALLLLP